MNTGKYRLGIIGLGTMGRNLLFNIADHQFAVSGYDKDLGKVALLMQEVKGQQVMGFSSLTDFISSLELPRVIILLVPAGKIVDAVLDELVPLLSKGDIVIDSGNSHFTDTVARVKALQANGLHFFGMGISGGEEGARFGPSMMPGGDVDAYQYVKPVLEAIAAKFNNEPCVAYIGPGASGHFVKMVHNGIEYGLMQAYAEGLNILHHANIGKKEHVIDAETTPLRNPDHYQYEFNLADITELWRRGSVVASWLLDLTANALSKDSELKDFSGRVSDSGEGRWTILASIEEAVPSPVLTTALYQRFSSRGLDDYAEKLLSAMRFEFGGHKEKSE
jgi:6-phosphogluconate dehydrogenase